MHELPKEEIEIQQLFESLDNITVDDSVIIELINTHPLLFEPVLLKLRKLLSSIEAKVQDEQTKNFEKRSKARIKNIEVINNEQAAIESLISAYHEKIQIEVNQCKQKYIKVEVKH